MCEINWTFVAEMLGGIGTFFLGLSALVMLPRQLGFKKEAKELKSSLKLMFLTYKKYMASEEGIVWAKYPADADKIVRGISNKTGLEKKLVRKMLDELKKEGKI